jgi:hypothetical protein
MAKLDLAFQLSANANGMNAGIDKANAQLKSVGEASQKSSAMFRDAAKITRELQTPTEVYASTISKLDKYLERGALTQEVYNRAVAKADAQLAEAEGTVSKFRNGLSATENVLNRVTDAAQGVGDSVKSMAEAGISVIAFGKDVAWTYLQWKVFSAIKNPATIGKFAMSALKGAMAARTFILAAKALGVGLALGGGGVGLFAGALVGLTNPLVGTGLLALNLGRQFLAAKDQAYETATAIGGLAEEAQRLGVTVNALQIDKALAAGVARDDIVKLGVAMSEVDVEHFDNLAVALDEVDTAGKRSATVFESFGRTLAVPFTGAFAAINSGSAALTNGLTEIMAGVNALAAPVASLLQPFGTMLGTVAEGAMKLVGILAQGVGVVLRLAGAALNTFLSPFIVGLSNLADAIRGGMNSAFDFIADKIDYVHQKLDGFYKMMAKVPVIGRAFAAGSGTGAGSVAPAAAAGASPAAEGFDKEMQAAARHQDAWENAIQDSLLKAERESEQHQNAWEQAVHNSLLQAEREAEQHQNAWENAVHASMLKAEKEQEQAVKNATKSNEAMDKAAARASDFKGENFNLINGKSSDALKANDIRSSEGISQFMALATGREDPAIVEYRKQNATLMQLLAEQRAQRVENATILGGAAA